MNRQTILILALFFIPPICVHSQGRIQVEGESSYDLGRYRAWTKKSAYYKIKNNGKKPLQIISIRSGCACATVSCSSQKLQPGETASITAKIIPNSIIGEFTKTIFIESSDPKNNFLKLTIEGDAVPIATITPGQYLYIGRIATNTSWSQIFTLTPNTGNITLGTPTPITTHPVTFNLSPPKKTKTKNYKFLVNLLSTTHSGDFKCFFRIPILSHPDHPELTISISGKIGKELAVYPSIIQIPLSDKNITRTFLLRMPGTNTAPEKTKVIHSEITGVEFLIEKEKNGPGLTIKATFTPEFTKMLKIEEEITAKFSIPNAASATIRFQFFDNI